MSDEVERVFSSSGLLITDRRYVDIYYIYYTTSKLTFTFTSNQLKEDIIEAIECLKSWTKAGVVVFPEAAEVDGILEHLEKKSNALGT